MSARTALEDPPFQPAAAKIPYFDPERRAWLFSRYSDVQAALRNPILEQATEKGDAIPAGTMPDHSELRAHVQSDISRISAAELHHHMVKTLTETIDHVRHAHSLNMVREIIHPWSVAMLLIFSGASPDVTPRLAEIATQLFTQYDSNAEIELDAMLANGRYTLSKSMFFGLTQTLPSFLANAWLALLKHPSQSSRILAEPDLIPNAYEELLRYAGVVQTLHRRATRDLCIGEIFIEKNAHVILKPASANFDPARFDDPYRLDIARRPPGQLSLGTGPHACVGAALVRVAFAAATPIFLAAQPALLANAPIEWTGKSLRWPVSVSIAFQQPLSPVKRN